MRFVLAIALFLIAGCGHESTRPVVANPTYGLDTLMYSADSTWYVTGRIIDAEAEEPLIGANAILRYRLPDSDSLYTGGAATNVAGDFSVLIHSRARPILVQLRASDIVYRDTTFVMPQFSATNVLRIGNIELPMDEDWRTGVIFDYLIKPMFDKTQTNARAVITQEEIQNLPIAK